MIVPSSVTAASTRELPSLAAHAKREERTLDLLPLVVADMPSDLHRVANQGVPTRMLHGALDARVVLNHVDRESGTFGERTELVVDGFGLDRLEGNKGCLAGALDAHVLWTSSISRHLQASAREGGTHLDAGDRSLLVVDDDRVDVASEDGGDGDAVLAVRRLAEVDHAALDAGEGPLEVRERLPELGVALALLLVDSGLLDLLKRSDELLVEFRFGLPAQGSSATGGPRVASRNPRQVDLLPLSVVERVLRILEVVANLLDLCLRLREPHQLRLSTHWLIDHVRLPFARSS